MSNFVLIFILACAGHGSHAQTLVETCHGPEIPECQSADDSADTSKDSVKLFQHRVEVGKNRASSSVPKMDIYPLKDEAEKHLGDVLLDDQHMEQDTSESGVRADGLVEGDADDEEGNFEKNRPHVDFIMEEDDLEEKSRDELANHMAQFIANEQDNTHSLALSAEDPVREPPSMQQLSPETRYGQCFGMAGGEERCQFAAGGECEDIPAGALDVARPNRFGGLRGAGYELFRRAWAACNHRIMRPRLGFKTRVELGDERPHCRNAADLTDDCTFSAKNDKRCPLGADLHVGVDYAAEWDDAKKRRFKPCGVELPLISQGYNEENSTYRFVNQRGDSRHKMHVHIQATSIGSILHDVCCGYFKSKHGSDPNNWPGDDGIGCQGKGHPGFYDGLRLGEGTGVVGIRSLGEIYLGKKTWLEAGKNVTSWVRQKVWSAEASGGGEDSVESMKNWAREKDWFHRVCGPEWFMASLHGTYGSLHPVAPTWSSCEDTNPASPHAWASKLKFSPVCGGGEFGEEFSMKRVVEDALFQWGHVGPEVDNTRDRTREFLEVSLTGQMTGVRYSDQLKEDAEKLLAIYKQVFEGITFPWNLLQQGPMARDAPPGKWMTAREERKWRNMQRLNQQAEKKRREAAVKIQRHMRAKWGRDAERKRREEEEAAVKIQGQMRAKWGRDAERKRREEEEAAVKIQSQMRDRWGRDAERKRREEEERIRRAQERIGKRRTVDEKDGNVTFHPSRSTSSPLAHCDRNHWIFLDTQVTNFKHGSAKRWGGLKQEDKACFCSKMRLSSSGVGDSSHRACVVYPDKQATAKLAPPDFRALSTGKGFYCQWQNNACVPKPDKETKCEDRTHEFTEGAGTQPTTCFQYQGYSCMTEESFRNCPKYCEICQ